MDVHSAPVGRLLEVFASSAGPAGSFLPKYRFPSAGSLYPLQIYLEVNGGWFNYDCDRHALVPVSEPTSRNAKTSIRILLAANQGAISSTYGDVLASDFSLLDAGYVLELVTERARECGFAVKDSQLMTPAALGLHPEYARPQLPSLPAGIVPMLTLSIDAA
eukprot:EC724077.1.p1 GENE.EC724077.1~~EC724077.1.p1  ORF type:complete len:162 (+),score=12.01 EC724077.1:105-590(+)